MKAPLPPNETDRLQALLNKVALLAKADRSLFQSKASGKNRVTRANEVSMLFGKHGPKQRPATGQG